MDSSRTRPEPFAFASFTWLNGNPRTTESPLSTPWFTGEFRADVTYIGDFNHPSDHTLTGSSESGRTAEIQVQQLGVGGDFHCGAVRGRIMTQLGMYATMTPRSDASPARGQWQLADAYQYLSEAYGGRHWNRLHGINVDAGIFTSYIGLFSYYNFDNWAYQPSYVSSNTPWFFTGVRAQFYLTDRLKIEPWLVNGFQSYGMFNEAPGVGAQVLYRPNANLSVLSNTYYGRDWLGIADRWRFHSDNSIQLRYRERRRSWYDQGAFSLTVDAGCESRAGVRCAGSAGAPQQSFLGFMLYDRSWFTRDRLGVTVGGGAMNNPGRYLVIMPPINGATASTGSPYFTSNPGDAFHAWDASLTIDIMPDQFTTVRAELDHREASVPYFAGPGGVTPTGGNTGSPGVRVPGFAPDLRRAETRLNFALLIKL
ncbi:MAG TPA: outer membrane beta-barrel protein [Gemmatimonadaceae bacterium]|nr:outer membrane beta-barrel protein [Gemmatimonadaceae bacterium]